MKLYARMNHIGWVHLWRSRQAFDEGEASEHFFNGKVDPRWLEAGIDGALLARMKAGELVEIEDPGYFPEG